ncbi:MAG: serine hydroxymethyltransferase, partial [Planctomycetes bacterium]|nr:serine hydroxymethyltransferase [Planctomycetota bacterium]
MTDNPTNFLFDEPLHKFDQETDTFLRLERRRQQDHIILVASESISPKPVRDVLSHVFTNIYAEGYPSTRMSVWERENVNDIDRHLAFFRRYADRRYYKGTEFADFVETLAQKRAAEMFTQHNENGVRADDVFVNVQPLSGAAANNAIYNAFVKPGDCVMGIQLEQGGHLSHGSPVNRSGMNHSIISYGIDPKTGKLDYDQMIDLARKFKPKMIIGGASAYPWAIDWRAMREAADAAGAILLADVAHPAGLIVAGYYPNPIGIADVITTTTHKTLCGPRGAIALTTNPEYAKLIDLGVFPGEQGGPHINTIAAKAVAFGIAQTPEFRELQRRIKEYAELMSDRFKERGFKIAYGGTDSHLFLLDLKHLPKSKETFNADIASRVLDLVNITSNKNTVVGDDSAANPTGLRIGTTWLSQLGFTKDDALELSDIIADTLEASKPFNVLGAFGDLGRGKLPLETLVNARERVAKLLKKHKWDEVAKSQAEDEYYILGNEMPFPLATLAGANKWQEFFNDAETDAKQLEDVAVAVLDDEGLIEIQGERAYVMLDQLCSADITTLGVGERVATFFFENSGKVVSDAWIFRLPDTSEGFGRYWIRVTKERKDVLYTWLQAHNDGYVLFEESDLYTKIDGPVKIKDLRARSKDRMFCFAFMGKNSIEAIGKIFPNLNEKNVVSETVHEGKKLAFLQYKLGEQPVVEVYADYIQAPHIAAQIKELFTEKVFAGFGVYN